MCDYTFISKNISGHSFMDGQLFHTLSCPGDNTSVSRQKHTGKNYQKEIPLIWFLTQLN